ncbi:Inducible metalloproteinase inhibitor protein [Eumeta japonica]|uniref:Inducible metalloproteinase inhibitor protein n=1 Tax=Eumeta variegata TaxID=151549 RepID=A0A4C1UJZ0_EUMVA|nr:Inducible metalloproteinase inhibitor protein [Eumeta japonica]
MYAPGVSRGIMVYFPIHHPNIIHYTILLYQSNTLPLDMLFLPKKLATQWLLLWGRKCLWPVVTTYSLFVRVLFCPSLMPYKNCPKHEHWEECPGVCPRDSCAGLNPKYECPPEYVDQSCNPDCVCDKGYLRNDKGVCVPENKCPKNQICGVKEVWKPCRTFCPPQTCESIYTDYNCQVPQPCEVGCDCISGYLRNAFGKCIRSEQCPLAPTPVIDPEPLPTPTPKPPTKCGPNSRYVDCKTECSNEFCPKNDSRRAVTCVTPEPCKPGCICNLNHKRSNTDGQCIVASDCPPVKCTRPNEVWDSCPSACLAEDCSDVDNQPVTCNTLVLNCEPRCVCKKGFYRNKHGICVKPKYCCAECGPNFRYVDCKTECSDEFCPKNDSRRAVTCVTPEPCKPGCICNLNHKRSNTDGQCIVALDCRDY